MKKSFSIGSRVLVFFLCGLLIFPPQLAFSQAPVASGVTSTTVSSAGNGVPVVNIAAPSGSGLSHNKFTSYNVDAQGLVLNNGDASQQFRQSQLAGQLAANPNLAAGNQARIILNEVTGNSRSTLAGFTEVLGGKADLIVANPFGITSNGAGFINTDRVSLVTGTPNIAGGALSGFSVNGGDILITGSGLNASAQQVLDLVSRQIAVQGQVNAPTLNLTAGTNNWNYNTGATSLIAADGAAAPGYAIDSSALGGMYAGRINLQATEAGVGVRMLGDAAATADDFSITSAGKIEIASKLSAARDLSVASSSTGADAISASDASLTAGRNLALTAASGGATLTGGALVTGSDLTYTLGTLADAATATPDADNNKRYAGGAMTLNGTGDWTLDGVSYGAAGALSATTGSLVSGASGATLYSGSTLELTATSGDLELTDAVLRSAGNLNLTSDTGAISFFNYDSGTKVQTTRGNLTLTAATDLVNEGVLTADSGDVRLRVNDNIQNWGGTVHAAGLLDITGKDARWTVPDADIPDAYLFIANEVENSGTLQGGTLSLLTNYLIVAGDASIESAGDMHLGVDGSLLIGSESRIMAATSGTGTATIKGNTSEGRLTRLDNIGTLYSGQHLEVTGERIDNSVGGRIGAVSNAVLNSSVDLTNAGSISSNTGGVSLNADGSGGKLTNSGTISAAGLLYGYAKDLISSSGTISNSGKMLGGTVDLYAFTSLLVSGDGSIESAGDLSIYGYKGVTLDNSNSRILAATSGTGTGTITTGADYNPSTNEPYGTITNYGVLFSRDKLTVSGGKIINKITGAISALDNLTLLDGSPLPDLDDGWARVDNEGLLYAGQDLNVQVLRMINLSTGDLYAGRNMRLAFPEHDAAGLHNAGELKATGNIAIEGRNFNNLAQIVAGSGLDINVYAGSSSASNSGTLSAPTMSIGGGRVFTNTGTIHATTFSMTGNGLVNSGAGSQDSALVSVAPVGSSTPDASQPGTISAAANPFPGLTLTLPTNPNGLFIPVRDPSSRYLVESNPLYTNLDNFLGSDYLAEKYGFKPDQVVKRLGDAAYETHLVQQQLLTQLGTDMLKGYASEKAQMQGLMDHAGSQAKTLGLTYGKPLDAAQQASLQQDMVWMVETTVAGQKVLTPVVYLAAATRAMFEVGSGVIAADSINMNVGSLTNKNGGVISGQSMNITAQGDIKNIGSTIKGGDISLSSTKGSIVNRADVKETHSRQDNTGRVYTDITTGSIQGTGTVNLTAGKNVENVSATVQGRNLNIKAGEDVINQTLVNYGRDGQTAAAVGTLSADNGLKVEASRDISNLGAQMSAGGDASLSAKGNVVFDTVELHNGSTDATASRGFLTSTESSLITNTTTQVKSGLTSGGNLSVKAKGDITLAGTEVTAGKNAVLDADGDINLLARENSTHTVKEEKEEGLFVGGGLFGDEVKTTDTFKSKNVGTTIRAGGDVDLLSGKTVTVEGSAVEAAGNLAVAADEVKVLAGKDVDRTTTTTMTNTYLALVKVEGHDYSAEANAETGTEAHANAGAANASAAAGANASVKAGHNPEDGASSASASGASAGAAATGGSAGGAGKTDSSSGTSAGLNAGANASAEVSASAGGTSRLGGIDIDRHSTTVTSDEKTRVVRSSLSAGKNLTIRAKKEITLEGAEVAAKGDTELSAENVKILAAEDKHETASKTSVIRQGLYLDSTNSAEVAGSANLGGGAGTSGFNGEVGAEGSVGIKSETNLDIIRTERNTTSTVDTTNQGTSLAAGGTLRINSGNKLTVQGSDLSGEQGVAIAAKDMEFLAGKDTHFSSSTSNKTSVGVYIEGEASANAGAGANAETGIGANAGANAEAGVTGNYSTGFQGKKVISNKSESGSTARVSTISSGSGSITRTAENSIKDQGTAIEAAGDFNQTAKTFTSEAAKDTQSSSSFEMTHSARAGMYSGATAEAGAGAEGAVGLGATGEADAEAKANVVGGVRASYSGSLSSESESASQAVVSSIKAGGKVKSVTTGKSSLEGTQISAGQEVELEADSLDYRAAKDTTSKSSTTGSTKLSGSAGVGLSATSVVAVDLNLSGEVEGTTGSESTSAAVAGGITSGGDIRIKTKQDTRLEGTNLEASGDTSVAAGGNLIFDAARDTTQSEEHSGSASVGFTTTGGKNSLGVGAKAAGSYGQASSESSSATGGSIATGGKLTLSAGKAASFEGTNLAAGDDATISGKEGVTMSAAKSTSSSDSFGVSAGVELEMKTSKNDEGTSKGASAGANLGVAVKGARESEAVGGSVSSGGNLKISSGKDVTLEGTALAAENKASIQAGGVVNFKAAESTAESWDVGVSLAGKGETSSKTPNATAGGPAPAPGTGAGTENPAGDKPGRLGTGGTQGSDGSKKGDADLAKWQSKQGDVLKEFKAKQSEKSAGGARKTSAPEEKKTETSTPTTQPETKSTGGSATSKPSAPSKENKVSGSAGVDVQVKNKSTQKAGSIKAGAGGIEISAGGGDVTLEGTNLTTSGDANISATGDVTIGTVKNSESSFDLSAAATGSIASKTPDKPAATPAPASPADTEKKETPAESKTDASVQKPEEQTTPPEATAKDAEGEENTGTKADNTDEAQEKKGVATGSVTMDSTNNSVSQGATIKTGGSINITSGGKTVLKDTKIKATGGQTLNATGGVVRKTEEASL